MVRITKLKHLHNLHTLWFGFDCEATPWLWILEINDVVPLSALGNHLCWRLYFDAIWSRS